MPVGGVTLKINNTPKKTLLQNQNSKTIQNRKTVLTTTKLSL
jgi:hypothetical protein